MKIQANVLEEFFKQTTVDGKIAECVLNFEKEGLNMFVMSADGVVGVKSTLNPKAFLKYEERKSFGIKDTSQFGKLIKLFGKDEISISTNENLLIIKSANREAEYPLPDLEFVEKAKNTTANLKYDFEFKFDAAKLQQAYTNADAFANGNGEGRVVLYGKDEKVTVETDGDIKVRETVPVMGVNNFNVTFGGRLGDIVKLIKGDVKLNVKTKYPLLLKYEDVDTKIDYFVAPYIAQDE